MIRTIICFTYVVLILLISLVLIPIPLIARIFSKRAASLISHAISRPLIWMLIWLAGAKVTVKGKENIPKNEPALFVINHRSFFDVIITLVLIPGRFGYVAKDSISKVPILSWWMKIIDCKFLNRKDIKQGMKTINECIEDVKTDVSIVIFPEGTRNRTEEPLLEFHKGSFKIGEKAESKVVPVVINNTESIFEKQYPKMKRSHVIFEFLPAIDVKEIPKPERKNLCDMVRDQIADVYVKNKELI